MTLSPLRALLALLVATVHSAAADQALAGHHFTLPDGFEVELVAGPPLVLRPIHASFDELGRLYVADSSGSNDKVEKQLAEKPHRVVRLEDTNGDGRFDKSTIFADGMMFPEGCLWLGGSLYVGAPPSIWKLTDRDGDGVAEERVEWWQGKTLTGCANDLHGPFAGPDGWIYWTKGAFAKQTHERPGKKPLVTRASHIFRARPDGSRFEAVMTGGMDNPVEVAFNSVGEMFLTTTFFQHPEAGRRDGLIHVIYGGVYGKDHDVLDGHPRTGELMPVLTHLGAAAPAGLACYRSTQFGSDYQDNLFAALFNLRKVTRHVLSPSGSTYRSADSDFLVSDNNDFHPTDVLEDADGSLLVVDTGGWYKLCCPTSQLAKPDVLGAIYRVRRKDASRVDDPRGLKIEWGAVSRGEIQNLLGDGRPAVRERAIAAFVAQAKNVGAGSRELNPALPVSRSAAIPLAWALCRVDSPEAGAATRSLLSGLEERTVAIRSASLWRDGQASRELLQVLKTPGASALQKRMAVEALGRIGSPESVVDILSVPSRLENPADWDRSIEHAVIFALLEIADPKGTAAGLASEDPRTRRAALIALDQMEQGGLKPEAVAALLDAREPAVRDAAMWIATRHPGWGGPLVNYFRERLTAAAPDSELEGQLARFAAQAPVQDLLLSILRDPKSSGPARRIALGAFGKSGAKEAPVAWSRELARLLLAGDAPLREWALSAVRSTPPSREGAPILADALLQLARDPGQAVELRLGALAAAPGPLENLDAPIFDLLSSHLDPSQPLGVRGSAARVLSRAKLSDAELRALLGPLKKAGPLEIGKLVEAFASTRDDDLGLALVATLKEADSLSSLHPDWLKPVFEKGSVKAREKAEELYALLNTDRAAQKTRLEALLSQLKDGDVRRGQAVFNSEKAACRTCHAMGYQGGRVGPDLTRIGETRTERDLLESLIFPSASFVRSYEPFVVVTKAGEIHNGLLKKESDDEIILTTGAQTEARVARAEIAEMRPSVVSVMPQGLDQQLTTQQLADLIVFLKSTRWGAQ